VHLCSCKLTLKKALDELIVRDGYGAVTRKAAARQLREQRVSVAERTFKGHLQSAKVTQRDQYV